MDNLKARESHCFYHFTQPMNTLIKIWSHVPEIIKPLLILTLLFLLGLMAFGVARAIGSLIYLS
ncbi:hypothetical protein LZP69_02850 [Shewanella sp. AS1]|uniref:hypothetical protein n=1 Tax=Shewanella sp. AS1 TaxID=2907626 RepID=UPI001F415757|nr:hypothetical protein [Shewanella sp. AS1]MCE9678134.1 hypothetical protein [Shewanella sp. AS1]